MCLLYILIRSPVILPHHPSSFLEQFQKVSLFYFHTRIQNTSTIFAFPHLLVLLSLFLVVPTPRQMCFTFLSFILKCILIVHGDFILASQTCTYHALIRLTLLLLTLSITLLPYCSKFILHWALILSSKQIQSVSVLFTL
jgi:hypothetical protein